MKPNKQLLNGGSIYFFLHLLARESQPHVEYKRRDFTDCV